VIFWQLLVMKVRRRCGCCTFQTEFPIDPVEHTATAVDHNRGPVQVGAIHESNRSIDAHSPLIITAPAVVA